MSDEDEVFDQDEEEELEADADAAADIDVDDDVTADAEEDEEAIAAKPVKRAAREEIPEAHSVEARAKIRNSLAADVEAFLARGGSIKKVADDHRADPPKKPESNYGRGSI
jgi:hypothetical protein